MSTNYRITIPQPCNEDWNKMKPEEKGRFCLSCAKTVVDFRNFSREEIQDYFKIHLQEKVCGRFKTGQLHSLIIEIPEETLYHEKNPFRIFKFSLLIIFGVSLFSCSNEHGEKIKIEKIIVKDAAKNTVSGTHANVAEDTTEILPGQIKVEKITLPPPEEIGGAVIYEPLPEPPELIGDISVEVPNELNEPVIYEAFEVTTQAEFPNLHDYIERNFTFENNDPSFTSGRCFVEFVVSKEGKVKDVKLKRGTENKEFNQAAIRLVKRMPDWKPAEYNDNAVDAKMILPIKYSKKM